MKAFAGKQTVWNEETGYHVDVNHGGMELRDYFAAKAMQGIVHMFSPNDFFNPERVTKISYQIADAMMKAREQ